MRREMDVFQQLHKLERRLLSSTAQGTAYEQHCMAYLARHLPRSITKLRRTGGAGDQGIDLTGQLEPSGRPLIVQCKSTRPPVGPSAIRELEGSLGHRTYGQPLGILFGANGFAPSTCQRCATSELPLVLLHLPPPLETIEVGDPSKRSRLKGALMSHPAQSLLDTVLELRKGIDADGEAFVRLQEVT